MQKPMITIFLIIVFLAGIYVYSTNGLLHILKDKEGLDNISSSCPNLLMKKDNILLLYNSQKPEEDGVNPIPFYNLDEYINYLEIQRKKGFHCPVLFLQNEVNTQGKEVYRIRPNPFELEGGVPQMNTLYPGSDKVIQNIDANRSNPPYNAGNYAGFDPTGLFVGRYTNIDEIHDSTEKSPISDNPMDSNWGGVLHTQGAVDTGKYDDNRIVKPALVTPKNTQFIPGLFGHPPPKDKLE
jgi:hypothetical protein